MKKKKPNFLRRTWHKYSKLGKGRKKKQIWRRPTGRDNKMREKRKGKPAVVSVGYKQSERRDKIMIMNVKDLAKAHQKDFLIVGNIGKRKKLEIAREMSRAESPIAGRKIELHNMNIKSFVEKNKKIPKKEKKVEVKKEDKKSKDMKTEAKKE